MPCSNNPLHGCVCILRGGGGCESGSDSTSNSNDGDDDTSTIPDSLSDNRPDDRMNDEAGRSSSQSKSNTKKNKKKKKKKTNTIHEQHKQDTGSANSNPTDPDDTKNTSSSQSSRVNKVRPDVQAVMDDILQHADNYYQIIGVSRTATDKQITKAYRKRVQKCHPDKTNGDRRAFDLVAEAYDVLSDETKRQVYDRFGKDGLDPTAPGGVGGFPTSYQDLFGQMFRQAQQQRQQQQSRNPTLRYQLEVQLEDLYTGCTQSATVSPPYSPHLSSSRSYNRKTVDVHIPKGAINGQSIVLSGEADFNHDTTPGDVIFILSQAPHPKFTRKGHDLAMELTIGLDEAITGFQRPIRHLDGTEIWIESARIDSKHESWLSRHSHHHDKDVDNDKTDERDSSTDDVSHPIVSPLLIRTGDVQVLKGRGMPKRNQPDEFGDLYVQYRVEMPDAKSGDILTESEKAELSRILTKLQGTKTKHSKNRRQRKKASDSEQEDDSIHILQPAKAEDFGRASGKVILDDDEGSSHAGSGLHDDFHPFASSGSSFFHSGGTGGSSRFYFGHSGNAFGMGGNDNDDGNVQCQQM